DIQQLFIEAQHRWLRPAEICEILRNYEKFHISTEPPNKPASKIIQTCEDLLETLLCIHVLAEIY
ncbi:Calmodulin-binding transcription activator 2, partial [Linum perenne]